MLYDRDYMRNGDSSIWRSPVVVLMIVLAVVFLGQCVLGTFFGQALHQTFGLDLQAIRRHEYWRLVTYQFLHSAPSPWHLLFNGLALWFFGRPVLEALGRIRFWQIYLASGLLGGFVELAFQAWHPSYYAGPTVGASASVLGLAGAYCLIHSGQEILFFFYVLPVRMPAMVMFWVLLAFAVFGSIFPYGGTAHAAHLGGLLTGAGFVKILASDDPWAWVQRFLPRRPERRRSREVPVTVANGGTTPDVGGPSGGSVKAAPRPAVPAAERETPEDFIRREVDPILDKISAHGIQSLTEKERRVLERARERMGGSR